MNTKRISFSASKLFLFSLFCICSLTKTSAAVWYVNDASVAGDVFTTTTGNDVNAGTSAAPFATIQFAINSASSGDTIYVDAGNYASSDIDISKSLIIRGAKFGIHAGPMAVPPNRGINESVVSAAFLFGAGIDNISIDGFTINVGTGLRGIVARGLNSVIINNILTGTVNILTQQQGLSTRANAAPRLHSYDIAYNNVQGFRTGIYMDGGKDAPSIIQYNYVSGSFTAGYTFTASNGHHIKANVSENNITGMLFTKGENLIEENTFINNSTTGLRIFGTDSTFDNSIVNNFFIDNGVGISLTNDVPAAINNEAHFNSFTGNTAAIANTHAANFSATCNWFGTTDPSAIAASISGNVTYIPFLTSGTDGDPLEDGFQPTTSCVVPVILSSFSATVKSRDVLLKWNTSMEINSDHFVIERSTDGIHFENIGQVQAKKFSNIPVAYNFTDKNLTMIGIPVYYRLLMIDRDGTAKLSGIEKVQIKAEGMIVLNVYPNPATTESEVKLKLYSEKIQQVNISIVNLAGQILYQEKINIRKGENVQAISWKEKKSGMYFVKINNENTSQQFSLIIR